MAAATQTAPAQEAAVYLARARGASSVEDCMAMYDQWAATYGDEVRGKDYVAPVLVAQLASKVSDLSRDTVLDAGCGTGLVGQALAALGAKTIDGLDLSAPMLKIARDTGVHRNLYQADMNKPLDQADETYDTVTCAGTFTAGHVGPQPALRELIRVTKTGGHIVATILEEIWETMGFKEELAKIKAENVVTVVADDRLDYVKGRGDKAIFAVLRKN